MPTIFYSLLAIITSAVISLALFFRLRKDHLLATRFFFWHYSLGFIIFSLALVVPFFINLRIIGISYPILMGLYIISLVAILVSYALFYRGTVLLFTKDKFITTIFPLIFIPILAGLTVISLFIVKIEIFIVLTAIVWGFLFPINIFLGSAFLYLFIKGAFFDTGRRQPHTLLLSFAWFLIFALDILLWFILAAYPHEFWQMKLASLKGWFVAKAIAHWLILIGFVLYNRYLQYFKPIKKE